MLKQIRHTLMKKLLVFMAFIFVLSAVYYSYQYYANNKAANWPETSELEQAFDKSIDWLSSNYSTIENNHNPALWWMLKKASDISDNKKLAEIFQRYKSRYLDPNPANIWTPYFRTFYKPLVPDISAFSNYAPYQLFFVYALSCNKQLEKEAVIQEQLKDNFCTPHHLRPRCATHQLMSVRLMQERYCGDDAQLAALSSSLQGMIISELNYDFRLTDSYLQRVLALTEAGNFDAIKPVWLQRILEAQNKDGGWDDLQPVITLSDTKSIGWVSTRSLLAYHSTLSDFHTTAQGIWLMALLLQHERVKTGPPVASEKLE